TRHEEIVSMSRRISGPTSLRLLAALVTLGALGAASALAQRAPQAPSRPARSATAQAAPAPSAPSPAEEQRAIASAQELGQAFTSVAERVSPSVVSVRVEARMPNGHPMIMPFGPFGIMPPEDDG